MAIVWNRIDSVSLAEVQTTQIDAELLEGHKFASRAIQKLEEADLLVGHGLLINDLRSLFMVTEIPTSIIHKTADTLLAFRDERSAQRRSSFPTGLSLTALTKLNLGKTRTKLEVPLSRYSLSDEGYSGPRQNIDPTEDALLAFELWKMGITGKEIKYGAGEGGHNLNRTVGWRGSSPGQFKCSAQTRHHLLANHPLNTGWHSHFAEYGGWALPDETARLLFVSQQEFHQADEMFFEPLKRIAIALEDANLLAKGKNCEREDLLTGLQFTSPGRNLDIRKRLIAEKNLTKDLREAYAWGLFQAFHPRLVEAWRLENWVRLSDPLRRFSIPRSPGTRMHTRDKVWEIADQAK
ncbi:hypothetical protein [Corynebacterium sp. Marseille-P3884]|uniref:hypothetical protein n=1 Tax=Corynebacterium sp. Marseille-P3884 TaxID=2495409 RepID=UPI001B332396|nr:hypothetical protein [Corynebacterium sp. Marseille-P3884]MBP3947803.1 hypothetical protein [Corynebacterium sp. Marseille-P3884]